MGGKKPDHEISAILFAKTRVTPKKLLWLRDRHSLTDAGLSRLIGRNLRTIRKWLGGGKIPQGPATQLIKLLIADDKYVRHLMEIYAIKPMREGRCRLK